MLNKSTHHNNSMPLTYGKNSTFLLVYVRAGDQLKYVVVQLIIESGGFILAQLQLNKCLLSSNISYRHLRNSSENTTDERVVYLSKLCCHIVLEVLC